jgi:AraC-like DNA-binding protein
LVSTEVVVTMLVAGNDYRYRYHGATLPTPPGTVVIAEPGEVYTAIPDVAGYEVAILDLDPRQLPRYAAGFSWRTPVSTSAPLQTAIASLLGAFGDAAATSLLLEERFQEFRDALSAAFLGLPETTRANSSDGAGVRRALEMLQGLYAEKVTVDDLTEASRLPKPRFLRAFKRQVGLPPHAYQLRLRVDYARRLMAAGASISEAALAVGFCDQSHLHRHFRRVWDMAPRGYKNGPPRSYSSTD